MTKIEGLAWLAFVKEQGARVPSSGFTVLLARDAFVAGYRASQQSNVDRPHHLAWNGTEWVDGRCGCRYHPDDDNGSHGGAPHVHRCEKHKEKS
jgi:hypothetical protein